MFFLSNFFFNCLYTTTSPLTNHNHQEASNNDLRHGNNKNIAMNFLFLLYCKTMVELFYAPTHLKHSFMFAHEFMKKHNNNSQRYLWHFSTIKKKSILHKTIKYVFHEITLWEFRTKKTKSRIALHKYICF